MPKLFEYFSLMMMYPSLYIETVQSSQGKLTGEFT